MDTKRELEEMAATLDDAALTLDELAQGSSGAEQQNLHEAQASLAKATDAVENTLLDAESHNRDTSG